MIAAAPEWLPLTAEMVTVPAATAVTSPLELTDATAALLVVHTTVWPLMTLLNWSRTVAESCCVAATRTDAVAGVTPTLATTDAGGGGGGAATRMAAVPDLPLDVAVMVTEPAATPVVRPLAFTVATRALLDAHVTVCPAITLFD